MFERMQVENPAEAVEAILRVAWQNHGHGDSFEAFLAAHTEPDMEARARDQADRLNLEPGALDEADGYKCSKCLNRGKIWRAVNQAGRWTTLPVICDCWRVRASILRLKHSGLMGSLHRISEFVAEEPWQKAMLKAATDYLAADKSHGESLFLGGAVGSGKTMLGSAVCRELLLAGHEVRYMPWVTEAARIKALAMDESQADEIDSYRRAEYLYIDDLFKPVPGQARPTSADVKLAYDIINYRYINHLPMIVSSEKYTHELMEIDEATVSRLVEMCKGYTVNVGREAGRNWRLRGVGEVV